jgi:hypothetical protein
MKLQPFLFDIVVICIGAKDLYRERYLKACGQALPDEFTNTTIPRSAAVKAVITFVYVFAVSCTWLEHK